MLYDNHKPFLTENQTSELIRELKKRTKLSMMIFIIPLNKAKQIKTIFKVLIQHINCNKLTITISIFKRLIIKLLVYLILLLFYKLSPYLIDTITYFTPTDTSIISMSVEEYDQ
jgi:hypothetical protein